MHYLKPCDPLTAPPPFPLFPPHPCLFSRTLISLNPRFPPYTLTPYPPSPGEASDGTRC